MTKQQFEEIDARIRLLKREMKVQGLKFDFIVDGNSAELAIVDKRDTKAGELAGMKISLKDLNKGLE